MNTRVWSTLVAMLAALLPIACSADQNRLMPPPPPPPPFDGGTPVLPFATAEFRFSLPEIAESLIVDLRTKSIPEEPTVAIDNMELSFGKQHVGVDQRLLADLRTPDLFRLQASTVKAVIGDHRIITIYMVDASIDCGARKAPSSGVVEYNWDVEGHHVTRDDARLWK